MSMLPNAPPKMPFREQTGTLTPDPDPSTGRTGGCTSGCGGCCEGMIVPIDPAVLNNLEFRDWRKWVELHGMILFTRRLEGVERTQLRLYIPTPCGALGDDKACLLHEQDERPNMCSNYPQNPMDLDTVDEFCTYKFEEVEKDDV